MNKLSKDSSKCYIFQFDLEFHEELKIIKDSIMLGNCKKLQIHIIIHLVEPKKIIPSIGNKDKYIFQLSFVIFTVSNEADKSSLSVDI